MTSRWNAALVEEGTGLLERLRRGEASTEDRWRLLVLLGRAQLALERPGALGDFLAAVESILPELRAVTPRRPDDELLNELEDALFEAREDELLDAILFVDDRASAYWASGRYESARALAQEAAALIALSPEAAVRLSRLAGARVEHLAEDAVTRALWHVIAQSPLRVIAEAVPSSTAPDDVVVARWAKKIFGRRISTQFELRAAAPVDRPPLHKTGEGWEINEEDGELVLQLLLGEGELPPKAMTVRCRAAGRLSESTALRLSEEPGIAYYALGSREDFVRVAAGGPVELEIISGSEDGVHEG